MLKITTKRNPCRIKEKIGRIPMNNKKVRRNLTRWLPFLSNQQIADVARQMGFREIQYEAVSGSFIIKTHAVEVLICWHEVKVFREHSLRSIVWCNHLHGF